MIIMTKEQKEKLYNAFDDVKELNSELKVKWGDTLPKGGVIFCVEGGNTNKTHRITGIGESAGLSLAKFCDEGTHTVNELVDLIESMLV